MREFLDTRTGKWVGGTMVVVALGWLVFAILGASADHDMIANAGKQWFICTETGKTFSIQVDEMTPYPAPSPFSGRPTGVYAEACFWTVDGKAKEDPTWVLLNERANKPGPTFCPDCGRLVTEQNPSPSFQDSPPPTKAEHAARANDPRP